MITKLRFVLIVFLIAALKNAFGQAPNISYTSPLALTTGTAMAPVKPANTGGAVPTTIFAYSGTFAGTLGNRTRVNGTGTGAGFYYPRALAVDKSGNVYVSDYNVIRKITPAGVVTTFAGTGTSGTTDGPATTATFGEIEGLVFDPAGNLYLSDGFNNQAAQYNNTIRKITPDGTVSTIAGQAGVTGALNGQGTAATFNGPEGLAIDASGNLYVVDCENQLIRKITPSGLVSTFAGTAGVTGAQNGPKNTATFTFPFACAVDAQSNVYVGDSENNLVRKIATDGTVSTLAGSGKSASVDGTGTSASFDLPQYMTIDAVGNIYVNSNNAVRKITPAGVVTTLVGTDGISISKDGIGSQAGFEYVTGVAIDLSGNLYVADESAYLIKKVFTNGYTISKPLPAGLNFDATNGTIGGTPAVFSSASYTVTAYNTSGLSTANIAINITGTLSFPPIAAQTYGGANFSPAISTTGAITYSSSDTAVATVVSGKIHIATVGTTTITASNGTTTLSQLLTVVPAPLTIIADNKSKDYEQANPALTITYDGFVNGDATTRLTTKAIITTAAATATMPGNYPILVRGAVDSNYAIKFVPGTLTILGGSTTMVSPEIKYTNPAAYKTGVAITALSPTNTGGAVPANPYALVSTIASQSSTNTTYLVPTGIVADNSGNIYVSHPDTYTIYKITPSGTVSVFAGSGKQGFANGTGAAASFEYPAGMTMDASGNIYLADQGLNDIRKITPQGVVTQFINGLSAPTGVAIDNNGNFYIAEPFNYTIMKVTPGGVISLFAGQPGVLGSADGKGSAATFTYPSSVTTDPSGNVYVADETSIRKITADGTVSTLAGGPVPGSADGIGPAASFNFANAIAADAAGTLYVLDQGNNTIRKITPDGTVITIAGSTGVYGTADGIGRSADFVFLLGIFIDATGNAYFCDDEAVRKLTTTGFSIDRSLPAGLSFDYSTGTISGTPTSYSPAAYYTIGAYNVSGGSEAVVKLSVAPSTNNNLSGFKISRGILTPAFTSGTTSYTASVVNGVVSMTVTPISADTTATITVNGIAVTSASTSQSLPLVVGQNTITTIVTAQDGVTKKTYKLVVTEAKSSNNNLLSLKPSFGTLSPVFSATTTSYTENVANTVTSITITPITVVTTSTVKVRGTAVTSGTASAPIPLGVGANTINTIVTAQDGTTKTYVITVTRAAAPNATLSALAISAGTLTPAFAAATTSYIASVDNTVTSITVTPTTTDPSATVKVRGTVVTSGTASAPIALSVGANTINTIVTVPGGTTKTYVLTVTRAAGSADSFGPGISVTQPTETPSLNDDVIFVHQGISPNGDGVNDFLVIDGIQAYPDNKLSIMNRNGQLIYEASGYDNSSKKFDGHSSKNGQMQLPGTYFFQLDYNIQGIARHKTGFLVLKY